MGALIFIVLLLLLIWTIIRSLNTEITVKEYQRGVKFTNGQAKEVLGPGRHKYRSRHNEVILVDVRQRTHTVDGQEVLTADGVSLRVSLAVRYSISDPKLALIVSDSYERALYLAVQIGLREVIGGQAIDDLLAKRSEIGEQVQRLAVQAANELGLTLTSVNVKDIMFPGPLKQTMGRVVEARKEAEAALERARGEAATLRSLANTARLLDKDPSLLQLRLIQTFAEGSGNTLILNVGSSDSSSGITVVPKQS